MFAQTQMESFWFRFFQKANGVKRGRAPEKTALFFLRSFFFCASCVKRKSERVKNNFIINQRTHIEKLRPLQANAHNGLGRILHSATKRECYFAAKRGIPQSGAKYQNITTEIIIAPFGVICQYFDIFFSIIKLGSYIK